MKIGESISFEKIQNLSVSKGKKEANKYMEF